MKTLIIYHAACMDGTFAATIAALAHQGQQLEFLPVNHGKGNELYVGDTPIDGWRGLTDYSSLIFVDITPTVQQLVGLTHHAQPLEDVYDTNEQGEQVLILKGHPQIKITVLDHHGAVNPAEYIEECNKLGVKPLEDVCFNSDISGSLLTYWKYTAQLMNPALTGKIEGLGVIAQYVSDRDTWKRSNAKAFAYYEAVAPIIFETLDEVGVITAMPPTVQAAKTIIASNMLEFSIERGTELIADRDAVIASKFPEMFVAENEGIAAPHVVASLERRIASEALHQAMAHFNTTLAISFNRTSDGETTYLSIRSTEGASITARDVAQKFGGNGHEHSAGCSMPTNQFIDIWGSHLH